MFLIFLHKGNTVEILFSSQMARNKSRLAATRYWTT